MISSPTNDSGGSSDGRGAEVEGRPSLARRTVSARRQGLHHETVFQTKGFLKSQLVYIVYKEIPNSI